MLSCVYSMFPPYFNKQSRAAWMTGFASWTIFVWTPHSQHWKGLPARSYLETASSFLLQSWLTQKCQRPEPVGGGRRLKPVLKFQSMWRLKKKNEWPVQDHEYLIMKCAWLINRDIIREETNHWWGNGALLLEVLSCITNSQSHCWKWHNWRFVSPEHSVYFKR